MRLKKKGRLYPLRKSSAKSLRQSKRGSTGNIASNVYKTQNEAEKGRKQI